MDGYAPAATAVIIFTSLLLLYILKKNRLLNAAVVTGTAISSVVISLLFPAILEAVSEISGLIDTGSRIIVAFVAAFFIYIVLVVLCTMIVSSDFVQRKIAGSGRKAIKKLYSIMTGLGKRRKPSADKSDRFDDSSVQTVPDESWSLDMYIDRAFSLKKEGRLEEAVNYYMMALDKKPDNDIVFWIILDVCTIYKSLGKVDLAKMILESYTAEYRDVMNENIRYEIEKNLLYT